MSEGTPTNCHFLSYSRSDEGFALRFAKDLRGHRVGIWIDQLDIRPSEHWDRAIEHAVRDCRGMVVILSPRSILSNNVADEISYAIDNGKSVMPVMIEKCSLPLRITRMQVIDATGSYERALEQCVAEMRRAGTECGIEINEAPAAVALDPEVVATTKRHLTSVIGPIAGIVVDKAAARASSASELLNLVAMNIEKEADRARFVGLTRGTAPKFAMPRTPAFPAHKEGVRQADVQAAARLLTVYIGPIATMVAKREAGSCASFDEFCQRLAALIPDERERSEFLAQAKANTP